MRKTEGGSFLHKIIKSNIFRGVVVGGLLVAAVVIGSKTYQAQGGFDPTKSQTNQKLQKNHVVFPEQKEKQNEKKDTNGDSQSWEQDQKLNDKLDNSGIPDQTNALFERNQSKKNNKSNNYVTSKDGKKTSVNTSASGSKSDKSQGKIKVDSGNGNGQKTGPAASPGTAGSGGNGGQTPAKTPGSNGGNGNGGTIQSTTKQPSEQKPSKETERPSPRPTAKPKRKPPVKTPSLPNGDRLIESAYKITTFPSDGVSEDTEKLTLSIIPIFDADREEYIYYDAELDETKLLSSVIVYVLDSSNTYKYRITSFNDNFKVSTFPKVATEDFTVTFSFRQNANAAWQQYQYTFQVLPYKFFVVDYDEDVIGSVAPDMSVNPNGNCFGLFPYYEKLLTSDQQKQLSRDKGYVLDKYIPGWTDEEDRPVSGSYYVAKQKGWKCFWPMDRQAVPSGYQIEMKWYLNLDDFDHPANLNYLQTLTKIPSTYSSGSTLQVMEGVHWVDLKDITLSKLVLPASTAVVSTDAFTVRSAFEVASDNPLLSSVDGVLYDKDKTKLLAVPSEKEKVEVPDSVTQVTIPQSNHIRRLEFKGDVPDSIDLNHLSDTIIWVPNKYYDAYVSKWKEQLPDSVEIYTENTEERVVRDNAILSKDGTILYRILSSVQGNYVVPDGVTVIKEDAMASCSNVYHVILPDSVKQLETKSLYGTNLQKVFFMGTTAPEIETTSMPEKDVTIYAQAQDGSYQKGAWKNWTVVSKTVSLTKEGDYTFLKLGSEYELLSVPADLKHFDADSTKIDFQTVGPGAFSGAEELFVAELPESVTRIETYAFARCSKLQSIIAHQKKNLTVAKNAYQNARNLRAICYAAKHMTWENSYIPNIRMFCREDVSGLSDNMLGNIFVVRLIGIDDFFMEGDCENGIYTYAHCTGFDVARTYLVSATDNIKGEIALRQDMVSILTFAFYNCSNEFTIDFTKYFNLFEINDSSFRSCGLTGTVAFGESMLRIEKEAFSGCTKITDVAISDNVNIIGFGAFSGCKQLQSVTFTENSSLETIHAEAFSYLDSLESITLPASLQTLEKNIFAYSSIKKIVFLGEEPPKITGDEFTFGDHISEDLQIVVPKGREDAYIEAWKDVFKKDEDMTEDEAEEQLKKYLGLIDGGRTPVR